MEPLLLRRVVNPVETLRRCNRELARMHRTYTRAELVQEILARVVSNLISFSFRTLEVDG